LAPAKVNKYHPDFKPDQVDLNKPTKAAEEIKAKSKEEAKNKGIKDKYIVIDVKNRGKKHYTTTVSGLENFGTKIIIQAWIARTLPRNAAKNLQSPAQQLIRVPSNSREITSRA